MGLILKCARPGMYRAPAPDGEAFRFWRRGGAGPWILDLLDGDGQVRRVLGTFACLGRAAVRAEAFIAEQRDHALATGTDLGEAA